MRKQKGFTLVETIVTVSIFLILLLLASPGFLNFRSKSSSSSIVDTFITDLKAQQIKAMTGDTEGRGTPDTYGVYIQPTSYVLFHGLNYSAQDTSNFSVSIDSQFQMSTTFANGKIMFASKSGEILNFVTSQNSIAITETSTAQQKVIMLNKYGTITQIN